MSGFSVAFAFAIAALLSGELDAAWARWSRPWTVAAWMFLTLGILLGSAWAYYVLGWGGWWFWDPVENASFMPWLVGTALIHSLAVTEKRGAFRSWTVLLAICTFSLSLLGTFLVRSGVLTSVHAFAVDPGRGLFILAFMVAVVGGSLLLFGWRAPRIGLGGRFGLLSRESLLLANNVVLTVAAMSVLIGTLYPLALDVLTGQKISVGPPYFEAVFVPIMVPAIFLMGVGPMARWKHAPLPELARRLRWALAASGVAALLLPLDAAGRAARLVGAVDLRAAAGGLGRGQRRGACLAAAARRARRLARTRAAPAARLVRHAGRACRHRRLHLRRDDGQRFRKPAGAEAARRASSVALAGFEFRFEGIAPAARAELRRAARHRAGDARRRGGGDAASGEAHLPRAADAAEPGRHRRRRDARSLRRAGRCRPATRPGPCACTSSPSWPGSGPAAC